MARNTFFPKPNPLSLAQIAQLLGSPVPNGVDSNMVISNVRALHEADKGDASFLDNKSYLPQMVDSKAALIFCKKNYLIQVPNTAVAWVMAEPYQAYAKLASALYPDAIRPIPILNSAKDLKFNISKYAFVNDTANIEVGAIIEAGAHIGAYVEIGSGTVVAAGSVIGHNVKVGRNCYIGSNTVLHHCYIGDNVFIHSGVAIGQDGFGYAIGMDKHLKVPQIGRVIIQNDVEIGSNTTIDRGTNRDTIIGEGTKIDNQVQIGHNVIIGRHCIIVSQVGIAGSAELEDFVVIGGQSGVVGHIKIGMGAQIASVSAVRDNVPKRARWGGVPAKPIREWFKEVTLLNSLIKQKEN